MDQQSENAFADGGTSPPQTPIAQVKKLLGVILVEDFPLQSHIAWLLVVEEGV
jgi:hypothetical protein